ncbi:MAG: 50S ribosomal protein L1 [Candidatus Eisenbacteria bacterium]|uniref:Large ribosomal subunit protein uL1 n=1 Tax=Eiseniibacteriota bacterium TaxID=2212470 RepID=A0A937XAV4_UNCEI|nr:50S ribosomal protein L1 [Candidatus Eisenbacteria bacterium]
MKHGKRYRSALEDKAKLKSPTLTDAVAFVRAHAKAKFDESIEVAARLGVDPKYADQMVRGTVVLPHGTGKTMRVLVFARGEKVKDAQDAGADFVGAEDLVEKVQAGFLDFDRAIATPDLMGQVGKLGRVLGPRGLMPNPKTGTVTFDVGKAVQEAKGGKIEFRVDKGGNLQVAVGRASFEPHKIEENIRAFLGEVMRLRPPAAKGTYVRSLTISSTMGPGVRLDPAELVKA